MASSIWGRTLALNAVISGTGLAIRESCQTRLNPAYVRTGWNWPKDGRNVRRTVLHTDQHGGKGVRFTCSARRLEPLPGLRRAHRRAAGRAGLAPLLGLPLHAPLARRGARARAHRHS